MTRPKDPLEVTPEQLASLIAETIRWEHGDFADGTWVNAPEAIIAMTEARVILCVRNLEGCTYSRAPSGSHRVFLAGGAWPTLNPLQRDSVCQLVWPGAKRFILRDPVSDHVIAMHALQEQPGFDSRGSD